VRPNLYGLAIALGILAAVLYMSREARRMGLPPDLPLDFALWTVPLAVVFSRLYYVAFTWDRYRGDLMGVLRVWEGGLAIYGGVIGGALGAFLLSKRRRIPFPALADLVAPGLLLAQAIGRWGNFFNGEAYGNAVANPALQFFPVAVFADGRWHLATFFYESVWNLAGFFLLSRLAVRLRRKGSGFVFLWYLLWYGLGRVVVEGLRTDSLMWGALRVSQALSALLVLLAGAAMALRLGAAPRLLPLLLLSLLLVILGAAVNPWAYLAAWLAAAAFAALLLRAFLREDERGAEP